MSFNWTVSARKFLVIGALIILCALSVVGGAAKPASAATVSPATSCYGGEVHFTETSDAFWLGPYTTTSRCQDINLRFTSLTYNQQVCVVFVKHTSSCNYWTYINAGDTSWHVIASDVLNGTSFEVFMLFGDYGDNEPGYIAF